MVLNRTNATVVVMMVAFIESSVAPSLENCGRVGPTIRHVWRARRAPGSFWEVSGISGMPLIRVPKVPHTNVSGMMLEIFGVVSGGFRQKVSGGFWEVSRDGLGSFWGSFRDSRH